MAVVQKNPTWINRFSGKAKTLSDVYQEKVDRLKSYLFGLKQIKKGTLPVRRKFLSEYYFNEELNKN